MEDFSCDHPDAVRLMIDFLYHGDYAGTVLGDSWMSTANPSSNRVKKRKALTLLGGNGQLVTHARMYAMGAKYLIESLKIRAKFRFMQRIQQGNIDPTDFAAAITVTYNTSTETDSGIGKYVFDSIIQATDALLSAEAVKEAIEMVDGLPYKLFLGQRDEQPDTPSTFGQRAKQPNASSRSTMSYRVRLPQIDILSTDSE
jgi:hypothetical protein